VIAFFIYIQGDCHECTASHYAIPAEENTPDINLSCRAVERPIGQQTTNKTHPFYNRCWK
jgi:hypothetical protein